METFIRHDSKQNREQSMRGVRNDIKLYINTFDETTVCNFTIG